MIRVASSSNGFACGLIPGFESFNWETFSMSVYHNLTALFEFELDEYHQKGQHQEDDGVAFEWVYANVGELYESLNAAPLPEIVPVCYGGVFDSSVSNIKKRDMSVWEKVENMLTRGDNIQEGHYVERSWANLFSTPLQPFQVNTMQNISVAVSPGHTYGALLKRRNFKNRKVVKKR